MRVPENNPGFSFEERLSMFMEENLGNESFGASELADQMNLSRSQLHRKIHQVTGKSTSQYMREFRLERAKEMLMQTDLTVAEIGYRCGFNSSTYFSSVFTQYSNITPGQFRINAQIPFESKDKSNKSPVLLLIQIGIVLVTLFFIIWFALIQKDIQSRGIHESIAKSVVIRPLHNLNLADDEKYICEGIVGAINRRLSAIMDLRVVHTAAEELSTNKTIDEIRKITKASYLLEGQIQRYRDTIRVEVNLVDLQSGDQIWGETYDRKFEDLLSLQSEIADKIGLALKVKLKLDERIHMISFDNVILLNQSDQPGLHGLPWDYAHVYKPVQQ